MLIYLLTDYKAHFTHGRENVTSCISFSVEVSKCPKVEQCSIHEEMFH